MRRGQESKVLRYPTIKKKGGGGRDVEKVLGRGRGTTALR